MIQTTGPNSGDFVRTVMDSVASIVSMTYGPDGGFVILSNGSDSAATKDGVSVVRALVANSDTENAVISIIREAALNTLKKVGDGTSSTIILANEILKRFSSADFMKKDEIIPAILNNIKKNSIEVEAGSDIFTDVALTATAGDRELSDAIVAAFLESGDNSFSITPEIRLGDEVHSESATGIVFTANIIDLAFLDDAGNGKKVVTDGRVVVSNSDIDGEENIVSLITTCLENDIHDLIIIAPSFSMTALSSMAVNHGATINITPLVVSSSGDISSRIVFDTIGAAIGATVIGEDSGVSIEDVTPESMALVEHFSLSGKKVIISGRDSSTENKISEMKTYLTRLVETAESDEEKNAYKILISIINKKIVKVVIGGNSLSAAIERRDRADDCINSLETALSGGVVLGGGRGYTGMADGVGCETDINSAVDELRRLLPSGARNRTYDPTAVAMTVAEQAIELAFTLGMTRSVVIKK
jgi:chaperonin GroEL